jgi:hypothetical protein
MEFKGLPGMEFGYRKNLFGKGWFAHGKIVQACLEGIGYFNGNILINL